MYILENQASALVFKSSCRTFLFIYSVVQVGAKSRNIANLRGKLPSWVRLPTSAALPFGVFEKVLAESINKVRMRAL